MSNSDAMASVKAEVMASIMLGWTTADILDIPHPASYIGLIIQSSPVLREIKLIFSHHTTTKELGKYL